MKRTNLRERTLEALFVIGIIFIGILAAASFACVIGQCDLSDVLSGRAGWVRP